MVTGQRRSVESNLRTALGEGERERGGETLVAHCLEKKGGHSYLSGSGRKNLASTN